MFRKRVELNGMEKRLAVLDQKADQMLQLIERFSTGGAGAGGGCTEAPESATTASTAGAWNAVGLKRSRKITLSRGSKPAACAVFEQQGVCR
jgi:hypothetical protein